LHAYLKGGGSDLQTKELLAKLLAEQQKTNRVLRAVIYTTVGFAIGVLVTQLLLPAHYF
jgi:ubiquinone biosynthesis protein